MFRLVPQEKRAVAIDPQEAPDGEKQRESEILGRERTTAGRDQDPLQERGGDQECGREPEAGGASRRR